VASPRLETSRLISRPPVEGDLDGWAAFDADARATHFFSGPKSRTVAWEGMASAAGMWALRGCGLFSVIEKSSGRWTGRIGPWSTKRRNGACRTTPDRACSWSLPTPERHFN